MSSPWAKITKPDPVNLQDIISEELAKDLQAKEYSKILDVGSSPPVFDIPPEVDIPPEFFIEDETVKSDAEIARMLQQQFDREYDQNLLKSEQKLNGTCKVSVSFTNYRRVPNNFDFESESEEEELEDIRDRKDWDRFDPVQREYSLIPSRGYVVKNGNMITKHDGTISGRRNACKMMSFPPDFETGDGAGFDLKLSNKVFNSLKMYSKQEESRRHKMHDKKEDRATAVFGMDERTRLFLYKMINNRLLEKVNGVVSIGKEAVVLHADGDPDYFTTSSQKECAIKVFKTTLSEYKQRDKYIKDDNRFKDRCCKLTTNKINKMIHLWAEKEMHNLNRLRNAGIPCPETIALKGHVLVMSFIGKNGRPAPKLKDVMPNITNINYDIVYEEIVELMKTLYCKANLIHADLSEYNILWHDNKCYIIDVSQAVEPSHENAFCFLLRDCKNIINFFDRKGVPNLPSPNELFTSITGCDYNNKIDLTKLQESVKMKPHLINRPGMESTYSFENAWEKSKEMPQLMGIKDNLSLLEEVKA